MRRLPWLLVALLIVCAPPMRAQTRAPFTGALDPPPDVAAVPPDAQRSPTGLAWKVIRPGTGTKHPGPYAYVTVDYTGWTTGGTMLTTTLRRDKPDQFSVNEGMKGWVEGIPLMTVGEKRRFWIPGPLAYEGVPGKPQGLLVFDIELIAFK